MIMKIFNQLIRVWERVRGDIPTKIALGIMTTGAMLLGGGGIAITIRVSNIRKIGESFDIGLNAGGAGILALFFGCIFLIAGLYLAINRYRRLVKHEDDCIVGIAFFQGFVNMNEKIPKYALSKKDKLCAVMDVCPNKIDSYDGNAVTDEYSFNDRIIKDRVYHGGVSHVYIAALGSVPYLYLTGTLFRDGHIPFRVLEHNRNENKWHLLDDLGINRSLIYKFNNLTDKNTIISSLANRSNSPVGLAISFTLDILPSDIPKNIQERTIHISLNVDTAFDVLPCEQIQEDIAKQLAHFMVRLAKVSSEIHLFICAQASFVLRLGMLYQNGMSGKIVIHNYDPQKKSYSWHIIFDGKNVEYVNSAKQIT